MVSCWVSLISTTGLPLGQFSSDHVETSFAIQGMLSALQTSAGLGEGSINSIDTDLAEIAYLQTGEIVRQLFTAISYF